MADRYSPCRLYKKTAERKLLETRETLPPSPHGDAALANLLWAPICLLTYCLLKPFLALLDDANFLFFACQLMPDVRK